MNPAILYEGIAAGRPAGWSLEKILIGKPLIAAAGALLAVLWISGDPGPLRIALGICLVLLRFFVPDLLIYSWGRNGRN